MSQYILGISCFYHDSAAALLRDGEIVSAVQEERFSRIKHDNSFPENSIYYILASNKLELNDIDYFSLIQFNFLTFRDGRPFTYAKLLRGQFKFLKEIRASGHVLPDQYVFLLRCGFNTVEIDEKDSEIWKRFYSMNAGIYYQ